MKGLKYFLIGLGLLVFIIVVGAVFIAVKGTL